MTEASSEEEHWTKAHGLRAASGHGLSTELWKALESWLAQEHCRNAFLSISPCNCLVSEQYCKADLQRETHEQGDLPSVLDTNWGQIT